MLNVTRIVFMVQAAQFVIYSLINLFNTGDPFPLSLVKSFAENTLFILFLNLGCLFYLVRMGHHISRRTSADKRYTRIMVPSFIFIVFADIFFLIVSVINGGVFRGWFAKKQPNNKNE